MCAWRDRGQEAHVAVQVHVEAGHGVPLGPLHLLDLPLQRHPRQQPRRQIRRLMGRTHDSEPQQEGRRGSCSADSCVPTTHSIIAVERRITCTKRLHAGLRSRLAVCTASARSRSTGWPCSCSRLLSVGVGEAHTTAREGAQHAIVWASTSGGAPRREGKHEPQHDCVAGLPSCPARRMRRCPAGCRHRLSWRACRVRRCPAPSGRFPLLTAAAGRRYVRFRPPHCEELPVQAHSSSQASVAAHPREQRPLCPSRQQVKRAEVRR